MPPIDVFYGVEHITPANTGAPVEGLPTRPDVASWITEHDQIESETEKFDKGDMIRLKKFAKGNACLTSNGRAAHTLRGSEIGAKSLTRRYRPHRVNS